MLYNSTRDNKTVVESASAIAGGISKEGGLFVPQSVPALSADDFKCENKVVPTFYKEIKL
jgi:threonine synthase